MEEEFSDEEVALIINTIQTLCEKVNWSMRLSSPEDDEEGVNGILVGTEEFFADMGLDIGSIDFDPELH